MKRNAFFIIMMLSLFLFGCHGERSGDITSIPGQSMTDFGGIYTEYESLAYVYDITPLSPPDHIFILECVFIYFFIHRT